jgi:hypothetical protein
LTGFRLFARFRYWRDNPPLTHLVHALAIWAGAVKAPAKKVDPQATMVGLRAMFPGGKI